MDNSRDVIEDIVNNIEKAIIGKREEILDIMKGVLANGHILIEDVPGVGKTTLIKALAKSLDLSYKRIQFTPDLLPSDITGVSIFNQKTGEFEFRKGPAFANMILADEINRTSPKTQSALLEVMEEKQISEGNNTYKMQLPFLVLATQNPLEYEGTFALPEAQLDRFMIKVKIGYPDKLHEMDILKTYRNDTPLENLCQVVSPEEILNLQKRVKEVYVAEPIYRYIIEIIDATRNNKYLVLGASPRASLALLRIAQATALLSGRDYVIPEDVKQNVVLVLSHRIILSSIARANNYNNETMLINILKAVQSPQVVRNV